jgi:hypothetical protein
MIEMGIHKNTILQTKEISITIEYDNTRGRDETIHVIVSKNGVEEKLPISYDDVEMIERQSSTLTKMFSR